MEPRRRSANRATAPPIGDRDKVSSPPRRWTRHKNRHTRRGVATGARELLSGASLTSILNDPAATSPRLASLVVPPHPGYDEASISLTELKRHLQLVRPTVSEFRANLTRPKPNQHESNSCNASAEGEGDGAARHQADVEAYDFARQLAAVQSSVPSVYFDAEFNLEEHLCSLGDASTGMVMQKRLVSYIDTIEDCLVQHMHARSNSFFTSLFTLHELSSEVGEVCDVVRSLRVHLRSLAYRAVRGWLLVLRDARLAQRLAAVHRTLQAIADLKRMHETVVVLLESSEFSLALDMLDKCAELLNGQLHGLQCTRELAEQLSSKRDGLREKIVNEFVRVAIVGDASAHQHYSLECDASVCAHLLWSLSRVGSIDAVVEPYATALKEEVRETTSRLLKAHLDEGVEAEPAAEPASNDAKASLRRDSFSSIPDERFLSCIDTLLDALDAFLDRTARLQSAIFGRAVEQPNGSSRRLSAETRAKGVGVGGGGGGGGGGGVGLLGLEAEAAAAVDTDACIQLAKLMRDALTASTESAHARLARVVSFRNNENASLSLEELRSLLDGARRFIDRSEARCGITFYPLRSVFITQTRGFLSSFHTRSCDELRASLDLEKWKAALVPQQIQKLVQRTPKLPLARIDLANNTSTSRSQEEKGEGSSDWNIGDWDCNSSSDAESEPETVPEETSDSPKEHLVVAGERFRVVPSLLLLLRLITSYLEVAIALPTVSSEALYRLIDLLKLWNERSSELILRAKAIEVMQRRISAEHLALSSQCLDVVLNELPVVRSVLAKVLPPKHHRLLNNLDQVAVDYEKHRQQLSEKIVSLMTDHLEGFCSTLVKSDWAHKGGTSPLNNVFNGTTTEEVRVENCLRSGLRQMLILHRILSGTVSPRQRDQLFADICREFSKDLGKKLSTLKLDRPLVQKHCAVNVNYVLEELDALHYANEQVRQALEPFRFKHLVY